MKTKSTLRGIMGIILVLASLLKLATLWGIMHISWLENALIEPSAYYLAIVIIIFVGIHLIVQGFCGYRTDTYMVKKMKIAVGIILVLGSSLKLATMVGIIHLNWLDGGTSDALELYLALFILLYVGIWLIINGFDTNADQWLQRPLPLNEDGKRILCQVSFGGDEYIYRGETFHGARLEANCGGIRLDLRNATFTEDEEIDIRTLFGGVELWVPPTINIEIKSRSFIGGVGNEATKCANPEAPCLHIIASNIFGGVAIRN
ncbi:MAG: cell wall-active antibiotics response protein [Bacteroidaceae bacterium]|nr:cell wall-active antibiotics response protein [Bacteroidaceae bacterium]